MRLGETILVAVTVAAVLVPAVLETRVVALPWPVFADVALPRAVGCHASVAEATLGELPLALMAEHAFHV